MVREYRGVVQGSDCFERARKWIVSAAAEETEKSRERKPKKKKKLKSDHLKPVKKNQGLRGLVATAPIARGETIVRLPVEAAIMVRPKMKCPLPERWCSREYWARAPWFTRAALMLLSALEGEEGQGEKKKGASTTSPSSSSPSSPSSSSSSSSSSSPSSSSPSSCAAAAYAAALPARGSFDTPAVGRWSDEELKRLHYGPLAEDVRAQRRSWSEAFAAYRQACPRSPIADDEQSWDWALSCVRSRAFSGPYAGPPLKQRLGLAAALAAAGLGSVFALHAPPEQVLNGAIAAAVRMRRKRGGSRLSPPI